MTDARMFAALSATNEAILRASTPQDLYQRVCDAAVVGGKFRIAGVLLPNEDKSLRIVAAASESCAIPSPAISVDVRSTRGHGLAGVAFRTCRSCISNDVVNDERLKPWREDSVRDGIGATAAVPIVRDENSIGVFLFCAEQPGSITSQMVQLLERMVENVTFALYNFEKAEERSKSEEAERRFSRILALEHAAAHELPRAAARRVFDETVVSIYRV